MSFGRPENLPPDGSLATKLHQGWCIEKLAFCPTLRSVICLIQQELRDFQVIWCPDLEGAESGLLGIARGCAGLGFLSLTHAPVCSPVRVKSRRHLVAGCTINGALGNSRFVPIRKV